MVSGGNEKLARRPLSYAGAAATEPRDGRNASPSNPTKGRKGKASAELNVTPDSATAKRVSTKRQPLAACVVFRCTEVEKSLLSAKAEQAGVRLSLLMREALGLVQTRRRKLLPKADPRLIRECSRIGGNLNQIAKWLNTATANGHGHLIDALVVARELVAIEQALQSLTANTSMPSQHEEPYAD